MKPKAKGLVIYHYRHSTGVDLPRLPFPLLLCSSSFHLSSFLHLLLSLTCLAYPAHRLFLLLYPQNHHPSASPKALSRSIDRLESPLEDLPTRYIKLLYLSTIVSAFGAQLNFEVRVRNCPTLSSPATFFIRHLSINTHPPPISVLIQQ